MANSHLLPAAMVSNSRWDMQPGQQRGGGAVASASPVDMPRRSTLGQAVQLFPVPLAPSETSHFMGIDASNGLCFTA